MTTESPTTIAHIIASGSSFLANNQVESPESVIKILLCRLLQCKPLDLTSRGQEVLSEKYLGALRRGLKRASQHEPVQHVVGEVDFMGHVLKSDARALIPRPETEQLVDAVLKDDRLWTQEGVRLIDFGTGSGCISIAIAKAQPSARLLAVDISEEALALARENAETLGVSAQISFSADELAALIDPESIDVIVSNPPYIPSATCETLPKVVRDFDPRMALDGGPNGLAIIEALIMDAAFALKPGGSIYLEIGDDQGPAVQSLLEETGFDEVAILPDLAGRDRIARGRLSAVT